MKYYVKSKGKTYGPAEQLKIRDAVLSGFFSETCLVSEDLQTWTPLSAAENSWKNYADENAMPPAGGMEIQQGSLNGSGKKRMPLIWKVLIGVGIVLFLGLCTVAVIFWEDLMDLF